MHGDMEMVTRCRMLCMHHFFCFYEVGMQRSGGTSCIHGDDVCAIRIFGCFSFMQ